MSQFFFFTPWTRIFPPNQTAGGGGGGRVKFNRDEDIFGFLHCLSFLFGILFLHFFSVVVRARGACRFGPTHVLTTSGVADFIFRRHGRESTPRIKWRYR